MLATMGFPDRCRHHRMTGIARVPLFPWQLWLNVQHAKAGVEFSARSLVCASCIVKLPDGNGVLGKRDGAPEWTLDL